MLHAAAFYAFALLLIGSALAVLLNASIVRAATCLLGALGAVAGFYLLLSAPFVAAVQLILYVGGVMVLIVFGVMLTGRGATPAVRRLDWVLAGGVGVVFLVTLFASFAGASFASADAAVAAPAIDALGREILTTYLLPFELSSLLLLAVLIGAAYLARPVKR